LDENIDLDDSIHFFLTWPNSRVPIALAKEKIKKYIGVIREVGLENVFLFWEGGGNFVA